MISNKFCKETSEAISFYMLRLIQNGKNYKLIITQNSLLCMPTLNKAFHHNLQEMDLNDNYIPDSLSFPGVPHQVNTRRPEYGLPILLPIEFKDQDKVS